MEKGKMVSSLEKTTVVIPAYNAERSVGQSVRSAKQIGIDQILVINDGSTDNTEIAAQSAGAQVISIHNQGASVAREVGLASVDSEYVIFLDADDSLLPGMRHALEELDSNPSAVVVGGSISISSPIKQSTRTVRPRRKVYTAEALLAYPYAPWPMSAGVWRTKLLRAAANTAPEALRPRFAEDFELLIRASFVGKIRSVCAPTCLYQVAGGKSAVQSVQAVRQSERIRMYYASYLDLRIPLLSDRALFDQANWRGFRSKQGAIGLRAAAAQLVLDPMKAVSVVRHHTRKLVKR